MIVEWYRRWRDARASVRLLSIVTRTKAMIDEHRPDVAEQIRGMTVAEGFRKAGRMLGVTLPPNAPVTDLVKLWPLLRMGAAQ